MTNDQVIRETMEPEALMTTPRHHDLNDGAIPLYCLQTPHGIHVCPSTPLHQ